MQTTQEKEGGESVLWALAGWNSAAGLVGLALAWGGLALALIGSPEEPRIQSAAGLTGGGAILALVCGLLHPRRGWTFLLVLGGGVFLGLFGWL